MHQYSLIIFSAFLVLAYSDPVSFITKCEMDDEVCTRNSTIAAIPFFAKGLPEFKVESLDPVFIKAVDLANEELKLSVKNMTVTGLGQCNPLRIQRLPAKFILKLQCSISSVSHYEMEGRLLLMTVYGSGKFICNQRNTVYDIEIDYVNKEGEDGKNHWMLNKWKYTYELPEQSTLKFENLLSGNPELAKATEKMIDENANDVLREIGGPSIEAVIKKAVENIAQFFKAVPSEDLALD